MANLPAFKDVIKKNYAPAGVINIEKLLSEGTETAVWSARLGKGTVIKFLILLISDLRNAFNVSRPMNESQITELAEDFVNDLWFVKFEEFPALFEGIKKGTIGKVYERLDGPLIWEFWDIYALKRAEVIEVRQNALSFRDPGHDKDLQDKREGKIEKLLDAKTINQIFREDLKTVFPKSDKLSVENRIKNETNAEK